MESSSIVRARTGSARVDHAALIAIVGTSHVLTGAEVRARSVEWGRNTPCAAHAIVRPANTAEVARVVAACARVGQTIVAHGGVTGLAGGAVASEDAIVLSLERLDTIERISREDRIVVVGAGVIVQRLHEAATAQDLSFPVDFGARGSATIGGAISTNAGGNRVLRFGMMRDQVLGVEAVLADGTIIDAMKGLIKDNSGYDIKQLMIGSEGTLGIVTRAVIRLRARLISRNTALIALDDFTDILSLLPWIEARLGGTLSAFEVMWREFYAAVTDKPGMVPPLPRGSPYYLLIEAEGGDLAGDAERFEEIMGEAIEQGRFRDAVIAKSHAERDALWALRDDIDAIFRLGDRIDFDVSLPASHMAAYVDAVRSETAAVCPGLQCIVFGHIADGNIHITALRPDPLTPELRSAIKQSVYAPLGALRGSVSAEHGIGLEKKAYLTIARTAAEIAIMRAIKHALDPRGLFNPGKIIDA